MKKRKFIVNSHVSSWLCSRSSCRNTFRRFYWVFFFLNENVLLISVFVLQILPLSKWFPRAALKLPDLSFKCQRCLTLAFQILLAFFNPWSSAALGKYLCSLSWIVPWFFFVLTSIYRFPLSQSVVLAALAGLCWVYRSCEVSGPNWCHWGPGSTGRQLDSMSWKGFSSQSDSVTLILAEDKE